MIPVDLKTGAEEAYESLAKEFHDATHNCFAYVIGAEPNQIYRFSDDGEPSGTAGKPIYETIVSRDLTNVLLVVTRYFGRVKLGTGGLGRAYRETARLTLENATRIERILLQEFHLKLERDQISVVLRTIAEFGGKPLSTKYDVDVEIESAVRSGSYDNFESVLIERCHGRIAISRLRTTVSQFDPTAR